MLKKKLAVYIGRFQPVHLGHLHLMMHALSAADHLAIVIGSSNSPVSLKNPLSAYCRQLLILLSIPEHLHPKVHFILQPDVGNDALWQQQVLSAVDSLYHQLPPSTDTSPEITLISHIKDAEGQYQQLFPSWHISPMPLIENLHATHIRSLLYSHLLNPPSAKNPSHANLALPNLVPPATIPHLLSLFSKQNPAIQPLLPLLDPSSTPFPTQTQLLSVITTLSPDNHQYVLLNKRPSFPGQHALEIPSIFPQQLPHACASATQPAYSAIAARPLWRNLALFKPQNTSAHIPHLLKTYALFDNPLRDPFTHSTALAFHFHFLRNRPLPPLQPSSTLQNPCWIRTSLLPHFAQHLFLDHYHILATLLPPPTPQPT